MTSVLGVISPLSSSVSHLQPCPGAGDGALPPQPHVGLGQWAPKSAQGLDVPPGDPSQAAQGVTDAHVSCSHG